MVQLPEHTDLEAGAFFVTFAIAPLTSNSSSAEAPLVLEEPSKIPKKHRSLETAKGERAHPKAAAKLVEGQPAGVARETAKSAEAQNLSGATKPSAPAKPTKPAKSPASAKPSAALKQSEAGPSAPGTGEEAGGAGAKPSEKAGKGGEKVGAKVADKAGNGKAAEGLAKGSEKVKAGAKEGTAKEGEAAVRSIQRPKKDNLMCSACKKVSPPPTILSHTPCPSLCTQSASPSLLGFSVVGAAHQCNRIGKADSASLDTLDYVPTCDSR